MRTLSPWPCARRAAQAILAAGLGSVASAHGGAPLEPHDLWQAWNLDPFILVGLALTAGLYGLGLSRLWRRAGVGRGIRRRQVVGFLGGLAALLLALVSPLDALSSSLFSAHMAQHLLLMLVAAPLLALALAPLAFLWALPPAGRRALGRRWLDAGSWRASWHFLSQPLTVLLVYTLVLWAWHLPGPYQAALGSDGVHALEHLAFLGAAGLFWWTLLQPLGRRRLSRGAAAIFLFAASLQGSALGLLMSFAPQPWYPAYAPRTAVWGLAPLQDQQLAGLIMWMPVGSLYAVLAAVLLAGWLRESERAPGSAAAGAAAPGSRRAEQVEGRVPW